MLMYPALNGQHVPESTAMSLHTKAKRVSLPNDVILDAIEHRAGGARIAHVDRGSDYDRAGSDSSDGGAASSLAM